MVCSAIEKFFESYPLRYLRRASSPGRSYPPRPRKSSASTFHTRCRARCCGTTRLGPVNRRRVPVRVLTALKVLEREDGWQAGRLRARVHNLLTVAVDRWQACRYTRALIRVPAWLLRIGRLFVHRWIPKRMPGRSSKREEVIARCLQKSPPLPSAPFAVPRLGCAPLRKNDADEDRPAPPSGTQSPPGFFFYLLRTVRKGNTV